MEDGVAKMPDQKEEEEKEKEIIPMVPWIYDLILWTLSILVDLFFREVHPRGSWKIPRRGPVIFVVAPHANQASSLATSLHKSYLTLTVTVRGPSNSYARYKNGSRSTHCLAYCRKIDAKKVYWGFGEIGGLRASGKSLG